jgi:hypothetical protein
MLNWIKRAWAALVRWWDSLPAGAGDWPMLSPSQHRRRIWRDVRRRLR